MTSLRILRFQDLEGLPSLASSSFEGIWTGELKIYVLESKDGAIACMLLALLCLGTWPAIMTLLERRGRLPQHTYLNYSITNLLAAVVILLVFGPISESTPEKPNFVAQLAQDFAGLPTLVSSSFEGVWTSELKMYVVESTEGAIACMLLSLLCLGTFPSIMTLLERRGRLPQHTYLDYSITNLLAAVIIALTFGQIGESTPQKPNFVTQLSQNNWPCVLFAMAGGVFLSLGNLASQYSWALVGLSVTEVVTCCLTVVIGTTLNYFLDNRINKAEILFPGVGCFLVAVCLGSAVHYSNAADNEAKLSALPSSYDDGSGATAKSGSKDGTRNNHTEKAEVGTAGFLVQLENKRAIKVFGTSTLIRLGVTFVAGLCFSLFSPAFNLATNDQWNTMKEGVPHLVVYTAFFYFSVSCFVIAVVLNVAFLFRPILNLPKSSFKAYVNDWNGRQWALLAGLVCGFGNGLQLMGGQTAGYAAADAVQAFPLVSTFWGILLFGEYRKSSRKTYVLLVSMLFMFVVAVGVLVASAGHRQT